MASHRVMYFCLTLSLLLNLAACSRREPVGRVFVRNRKRHVKTLPTLVGGATKLAGRALDAMQAHHYIEDDILRDFSLKSLPRETKVFAQQSDVQRQLTAIVDTLVRYDSLLKAVRYDELTLRHRHIAGKVARARAAGGAVLSRLRQTVKQDMHCDDISLHDDQTTTPKAVSRPQDRQLRAAMVMYKYRGFLWKLGDYVTGLCMTSCGRCGE
ncbi:uncharacterized protein [Branchiostoma lanceolatum]|uniref:uncharacterized protein n=1 Tax=Branchiostoma lanceolatum TaxID=7740 RepID=UPI003453FCB1